MKDPDYKIQNRYCGCEGPCAHEAEQDAAPKDYLGSENTRNKKNAKLFEALIKAAYGEDNDVLIGHHLTFEKHGDIETENEIPAADTLIFCHDLMGAIFGDYALSIMRELVGLPAEKREERLGQIFYRPVHQAAEFDDGEDTTPWRPAE